MNLAAEDDDVVEAGFGQRLVGPFANRADVSRVETKSFSLLIAVMAREDTLSPHG